MQIHSRAGSCPSVTLITWLRSSQRPALQARAVVDRVPQEKAGHGGSTYTGSPRWKVSVLKVRTQKVG